MEKNQFQTLAEAIEAGEPPIIDKVIGGVKERVSFWVDIQGDMFVLENIYKTVSGKYIMIARPRTNEEKEAQKAEREQEKAAERKDWQERIGAIMTMPGYILVAWANPIKSDGKFNYLFGYPETHAYYLPESGARYVYQRRYKLVYEPQENGIRIHRLTAKPGGEGWSRWGRAEIAKHIKSRPDDFIQCAPIWLLTSIPDPRPRFLAGKE
jgi:hypothetical protein